MVTTLSNSPTPLRTAPHVFHQPGRDHPPFSVGGPCAPAVPHDACGVGSGLAACPSLGLLVSSDYHKNTISAWALPDIAPSGGVPGEAPVLAGAGAVEGLEGASASSSPGTGCDGLTLVCTLGGAASAAPMRFQFNVGEGSGSLAFTPPGDPSARPLLLVTDAGADAVHLVDVMARAHAGYVAPPGSIAGPRGVVASGASPLVAVSAWKKASSGDRVVVVYRGSGAVWEAVRVIGGGFWGPGSRDGQLDTPHGLRFSGNGSTICVADLKTTAPACSVWVTVGS